jgi:hypothetical protein
MLKEYYIPKNSKYVFVSDFFCEDLIGGAELTTEAFYQGCPSVATKIHSHSLTEKMVSENPDKHWVITNFSKVDKNAIIEIVKGKHKYSIVEYDYKYCKYRAPTLHQLKDNEECKCEQTNEGKFVAALMARAHSVFFMSKGQMDFYLTKFPPLKKSTNLHVQSSAWSKEDLEYLADLSRKRDKHNNKCAVLGSGSWVKGKDATENFCKEQKLQYELLPKMPYRQFLKALSQYKSIAFMPLGFDTCPRLIVEARLMGLDIFINENVQNKDEEWFKSPKEDIFTYLNERVPKFWDIICS